MVLMVGLLVLVAGACTRHPAAVETRAMLVSAAACPNTVEGTLMSLTDTPDGIAITFTTTTDAVEVRRRAATLADRIVRSWMLTTDGSAAQTVRRPPKASARVEAIPAGARILVTTGNPAELEALRAEVRGRELPMREGDCTWRTRELSLEP
jgi:hypothetical protein